MENHIRETVEKHFEEHTEYVMRNPLLFGDYRNAMSEGEQRDYEDLLDFDAVYHLFQEVSVYTKMLVIITTYITMPYQKGRCKRKNKCFQLLCNILPQSTDISNNSQLCVVQLLLNV